VSLDEVFVASQIRPGCGGPSPLQAVVREPVALGVLHGEFYTEAGGEG
jgi:hypothetical protein